MVVLKFMQDNNCEMAMDVSNTMWHKEDVEKILNTAFKQPKGT